MLTMIAAATLAASSASGSVPPTDWVQAGEATIERQKARTPNTNQAKNVILFVADGMDVTTITAARIYAGQKTGALGEEHVLAFETLPWVGLSKTYNTNAQTPDSAGTATAMMTGHKTRAGVISVSETVPRGDCAASIGNELPSMMDLAHARGRKIGIISTARLTHATPATVYAHSANRGWEADTDLPTDATACTDIAAQLIDAGRDGKLSLALGGGRRNFLPEDTIDPEYAKKAGARGDERDLTAEWAAISDDHQYVWNAQQLAALSDNKKASVLGLFEPSHMQFELDRADDAGGEPSLSELTGFAIDRLATNDDGFFLMVEGGRVDHAHHGGNAARALEDTVAFDAAVKTALDKTNSDDTLIIVTADHGHTLVFQGYPHRGNPILGVVKGLDGDGEPSSRPSPAADGKPYTTLGYGNGPGSPFARSMPEGGVERPFVSDAEAQAPDYRQQAAIPSMSETHGGQDVSIYASGPMSHLASGVLEQNVIYYIMREALTAPEAE